MKTKVPLLFFCLTCLYLVLFACGTSQDEAAKSNHGNPDVDGKHAVTLIELGSVRCVPCRQMQPILDDIKSEYRGKVRVVFHDVWKNREPARRYRIRVIPTQVFLDAQGNEFFRHEGFLPRERIVEIVQRKL